MLHTTVAMLLAVFSFAVGEKPMDGIRELTVYRPHTLEISTNATPCVLFENETRVDSLISYAHKFLGYKYVHGGTTPRGFDCSGFVYYVYNSLEFSMPRVSSEMVKLGHEIEKDEIAKGDVIFFKPTGGGKRIGHVGIAINEPGEPVKFIHASTYKTGVKLSSLDEGKYPQRYITARRYL